MIFETYVMRIKLLESFKLYNYNIIKNIFADIMKVKMQLHVKEKNCSKYWFWLYIPRSRSLIEIKDRILFYRVLYISIERFWKNQTWEISTKVDI